MIDLVLASSDDSSGAGTGVGVVLWVILFIAYWIPTIIAVVRGVPNKGSVIVINFFLGWTFIGWIVALAMSVRSKPDYPQVPPGYYPPPPGYPPQAYPPSGGHPIPPPTP